ncbi:MAG: hypothetical protein AB7E31_07655 [Desulfitobacterium sp.]
MPSFTIIPKPSFLLNETSFFTLDQYKDGIALRSSTAPRLLFELKEPVLLAQGIMDDANQVHLAYIKESGELCYSIILTTGDQQTMTLGKLDIRSQRYDRLLLFPMGKVIHLFYASSHNSLPDVWRITHLFWNGQTWKSAQLGEVVHPRYPLYQVLMDSNSNLHALMMTFSGSRSILLTSVFNGSFYLWSKRQEVLSIPREVIDMTGILSTQDQGHLFWAAKQPGSDAIEIGHGILDKMNGFRSSWRIESAPANNLEGPWQGIGALQSRGVINLLVHCKQAILMQAHGSDWKPVRALSGSFSPLQIAQKSEGITTYTHWLSQQDEQLPLYADLLGLPISPAPSTIAPPIDPSSGPTNDFSNSQQPQSAQDIPTDNSPEIDDLKSCLSKLQETASPLPSNLENWGEKINSLPEMLDILKKLRVQNEQTLDVLQDLETKICDIQTQKEVASKKGFWQRWLT